MLPVVNKFESPFITSIKKQSADMLTHNSEKLLQWAFYLQYLNNLYVFELDTDNSTFMYLNKIGST